MNNDTYNMLSKRHLFAKSSAGSNKFHCPNCGKNDFEVKPSDGTYTCWSGGCNTKDIRAAIDKLEGKTFDPKSKTVDRPIKSTRPKAETHHYYPSRDGSDLVRTTRVDDGNGGKSFYQAHWNGFSWVKGNPTEFKANTPIYRYADVRQAIAEGRLIFVVEGESCVDALWDIDIPATTTIGGAGKFAKYGDYSTDFDGGKFILAPDCDAVGIKHMADVYQFLGDKVQGYYLAGSNPDLWVDPCGGFDIGDDIADRHLDRDRILASVISADEYRSILNPDPKKPVGRPRKPVDSEKNIKLSSLELAEKLADEIYQGKIRYESKTRQYWEYGSGVWTAIEDTDLFGIVQDFLDTVEGCKYGARTIEEVIKLARRKVSITKWVEPEGNKLIPFINGVYDIESKALLPHSESFGFKWQMPRHYSAGIGDWSAINRFLSEFSSQNNDLKNILLAFCNVALVGSPDLQKFLYLSGSGRNGKGTFIRLLELLVGDENRYSTSIASLCDNRFTAANIRNKRLVTCPEENKKPDDIGIFKSATGMDNIEAEIKGKQSVNFTYHGIFIVSANKPTFHGDNNVAIKERKVDFPCLYTCPEELRRDLRPEFDEQISAFTSYILSIDPAWAKNIIKKAGSVALVKKLASEMAFRENNIEDYFDKRLVFDPTSSIQSSVLYKNYREFCEENGGNPKSQSNFTPLLFELCNDTMGMGIAKTRTKKHVTIIGIRLATDLDDYLDPIGVEEMYGGVDRGVIVEPIQGKGSVGYVEAVPKNHGLYNRENTEENNESELNKKIAKSVMGDFPPSPTPKTPEINNSNGLRGCVGENRSTPPAPKEGDRVKITETHHTGTVAKIYRIDNHGTTRLQIALDNGSTVHKHPYEVKRIE